MNVAVTYSGDEEKKNWGATKCHWSQFTEEEIKEMIELDTKDKSNTIYCRRFYVMKGMQKEF
jgi:hypothetical protein